MPPVRMEFAWCVDRIVYAPHAASDTATRRYVCIECKGGSALAVLVNTHSLSLIASPASLIASPA
jgi:hypothetical protein